MKKNSILDYFLFALAMSLAWSLRGQFGHLIGALIPGAVAPIMIVLLNKEESWQRVFGRAVILSALGFSVGGHMSYGRLIDTILVTTPIQNAYPGFLKILWTGAIWGGVGGTLLGYGFCEKKLDRWDIAFLVCIALFWFIPLGIYNLEAWDRLLFTAGFFLMHAYNFQFKKSKMIFNLGCAGAAGFGIAFTFAVALLYMGRHAYFSSGWEWFVLRDQILGFIGGLFIFAAVSSLRSQNHEPDVPLTFLNLYFQKAGFIFWIVLIPIVNTWNTFDYWNQQGPSFLLMLLPLAKFSISILFFFLSIVCLWMNFDNFPYDFLKRIFFFAFIFFIWYLSAVAIGKQTAVAGLERWEAAYGLFLIDSLILTMALPFKIQSPKN